ncbi:MAG: hypothetical protein PVJ27_00715 [Candidatus Brocadiaceae bacterium]
MTGLSGLAWKALFFAQAAADPAEGGAELSGLSAWLRGVFDDHRLAYAFLTVAALLGAGALMGVLTEAFLSLIGMETEEVDHAE